MKIGIDKNRMQPSAFYRLITEIGRNRWKTKLPCKIDIIDFLLFSRFITEFRHCCFLT